MIMTDEEQKMVQSMIEKAIKSAMGFSTRKLGDTPTDNLQLVPRKYVNLATPVAQRPASVFSANQTRMFFNMTSGIPNFFNPNSSVWVSATGSVVASNL